MTEKQNNASSTTTISATQLNSTDLLIAEANSNLTISSMEVAEMMNKEHYHVIRDIRKYIKYLESPEDASMNKTTYEYLKGLSKNGFTSNDKFNASDFFQEAFYTDSQGKIQPYFTITKKGCDFLAHKATGQKGAKFTARYINRFLRT